MSIAAGRLNRRIDFLQPKTTLSPAHEAVVTYDNAFTVWAEVKQTSADEVQAEGRIVTRTKYTVIVRFLQDVSEEWQIECEGKRLLISGIIVRGRNEELEITCHEVR